MADSIRVLHVEDDPEFGALTAEALELEDDRFEVTRAITVQEGKDRLTAGVFDCVVSDYELPDQTGIEFLERVRDAHPDLPFILFTGKGSEEVASEAIFAGVTDYLQKEGGVDQFALLANRVANAVEGHRSQQILTERNQELRIYERIFNTMEGGACLYDREGRFEIVNDFLVDFYGTTRAELEGSRSGLIARIREEAEGDPYQELIDGERDVLEGEIEMEEPNAGTVVTEYRLTPLIVDGSIEGVVGVARDITERVEHQHRLENFAAVVSHDLRNPLTVAQSRLELVGEDCSSPHLADVERAHDRMVELIEDLLTLARDGERLREREAVDLATLVDRCWKIVQTGGATLEVDVSCAVVADRSRLQQLLENLVRNAIEHGGAGVTITVGETADGFYVEDDGPGIPPERRDGVLDLGYSPTGGSTGIGLSIVERVAEDHDWAVEVTEGSDGGARFEISDVEFAQGT